MQTSIRPGCRGWRYGVSMAVLGAAWAGNEMARDEVAAKRPPIEPGPPSGRITDQGINCGADPGPAETTMTTASGRGAELALGAEPDLYLDGRCCCDQSAAHRLVRAGLITAAPLGPVGRRVVAALTPAGRQALVAVA